MKTCADPPKPANPPTPHSVYLLKIAVKHITGIDLRPYDPSRPRKTNYRRNITAARTAAIYIMTHHLHMAQTEIAPHLGITQQAVSHCLRRAHLALSLRTDIRSFHHSQIANLITAIYQAYLRAAVATPSLGDTNRF